MGTKIFTKYTLPLIWDFTVHRKDGDKRMERCRTFVQIFTLSYRMKGFQSFTMKFCSILY